MLFSPLAGLLPWEQEWEEITGVSEHHSHPTAPAGLAPARGMRNSPVCRGVHRQSKILLAHQCVIHQYQLLLGLQKYYFQIRFSGLSKLLITCFFQTSALSENEITHTALVCMGRGAKQRKTGYGQRKGVSALQSLPLGRTTAAPRAPALKQSWRSVWAALDKG